MLSMRKSEVGTYTVQEFEKQECMRLFLYFELFSYIKKKKIIPATTKYITWREKGSQGTSLWTQ